MENNLTSLFVAGFPSLYLLFVPVTIYASLQTINHFFKFWDSDEKLLDILLVALFFMSLASFIAFFFVVRGLEFCA